MNKLAMKFSLLKDNFIEKVKYDYNPIKKPLVWLVSIFVLTLKYLNFHERAFDLASKLYRTGWPGSFNFGINICCFYFKENPHLGKRIVSSYLENIHPRENTRKFFDDPAEMIDGIVNILKVPSENEKGVLIVNYNYYFPLFFKFFDLEKLTRHYIVILEPSWAGYCDLGILSYSLLESEVYVQTYERRDREFINKVGMNFVPVDVGPNWFVNHNTFKPNNIHKVKDIDVLVVSAWAKFKRHRQLFKALSKVELFEDTNEIKIVCIGYPADLTKKDIESYAKMYGLERNVELYEWLNPEEVAKFYNRAKVNILWSRFEGNNRSVIEGMLCNTPCILRQGHNYGQNYDYINNCTGAFSDERDLPHVLKSISKGEAEFHPRQYVIENHSCYEATKIINEVIKEQEVKNNRVWITDLEVKTNELHGMNYLRSTARESFSKSHSELKKFIKR